MDETCVELAADGQRMLLVFAKVEWEYVEEAAAAAGLEVADFCHRSIMQGACYARMNDEGREWA